MTYDPPPAGRDGTSISRQYLPPQERPDGTSISRIYIPNFDARGALGGGGGAPPNTGQLFPRGTG